MSEAVDAIVVDLQQVHENDILASFLTKEGSVIKATMYGGGKSHLKGLVTLWNKGRLNYTKSPKNAFLTIKDFDVKEFHLTLNTNLTKMWYSSLCAELITKTLLASEKSLYPLTSGFINGLDKCNTEVECKKGLVRYLYRLLSMQGVAANTECCAGCQKSLFNLSNESIPSLSRFLTDTEPNAKRLSILSPNLFYSKNDSGYLCYECNKRVCAFNQNVHYNSINYNKYSLQNKPASPFIALPVQCVIYLYCVSSLPPLTVQSIEIEAKYIDKLKTFLFYLLENYCEKSFFCIQNIKSMGL